MNVPVNIVPVCKRCDAGAREETARQAHSCATFQHDARIMGRTERGGCAGRHGPVWFLA